MGKKDPRVDAYIEKSADFARPILTYLRGVVHEACPQCEEAMKWSMPAFMYHGMLANMAAFKQHAAFGFWKGTLIVGKENPSVEAMGSFGRITKLSDLPPKRVLVGYIRQAMKLNEEGAKAPLKAQSKKPVKVHPELKAALAKNRKARETFEGFSPSHRREYADWIAEAKGDDTRKRRIATAIEWLSEGKPRNWKYIR